jgi:hypothetical protein
MLTVSMTSTWLPLFANEGQDVPGIKSLPEPGTVITAAWATGAPRIDSPPRWGPAFSQRLVDHGLDRGVAAAAKNMPAPFGERLAGDVKRAGLVIVRSADSRVIVGSRHRFHQFS